MDPEDTANDDAQYAALAQEMAQVDAEEGKPPADYGPAAPPAEQYDSHQHGVPHQPQQQYTEPPLPDVHDDPILHFDTRMRNMEQHAATSAARNGFWENVHNSERVARDELGDDYDNGCVHLEQGRIAELERALPDNSQQAHLLAHQYGLPNAAALRLAVLNRDRVAVADHAIRSGIPPSQAYYELAVERGYRPERVFTKSQQKQLSRAIEHAVDTGDDSNFEQLWRTYEKASKTEEDWARTRRRR